MHSDDTSEVTVQDDLRKVREFLEKGILDKTLALLDPDDVKGTLAIVPVEIARLLTALLLRGDSVDQVVSTLKSEERKPIQNLLKAARRHRGVEFAQAFGKLIAKDKEFGRQVGMETDQSMSQADRQMDNQITGVVAVPQLMLRSRRVYLGVGFMRDGEVLFRTNIELDDLTRLIVSLLNGVEYTLESAEKIGPSLQAKVAIESIKTSLKSISKQVRSINNLADKIVDQASFPKAANKSSKKASNKGKNAASRRTRGPGLN